MLFHPKTSSRISVRSHLEAARLSLLLTGRTWPLPIITAPNKSLASSRLSSDGPEGILLSTSPYPLKEPGACTTLRPVDINSSLWLTVTLVLTTLIRTYTSGMARISWSFRVSPLKELRPGSLLSWTARCSWRWRTIMETVRSTRWTRWFTKLQELGLWSTKS